MAKRSRLDIVIEVVHNQEIKKTVIVVVKPASRHCPGLAETGNLTADASLCCHVGKRAIAVIVK